MCCSIMLSFLLLICISHSARDNESIGAQDTYILKELETKLSDAVMGAKNAIKSESNLVKKCILRRGATFYTAVKRIKGNKKPRQTITRRAIKNQCANNAENSAIICPVRTEVGIKPFLRTSDRQRSKGSNASCVIDSLESFSTSLNTKTRTNKKLTGTSSFVKTDMSSEETAVVRHGAKRLKIISNRTFKTLPEIGESSCTISAEETSAKVPSKISSKIKTCDKANVKITRNRDKKHYRVLEQMKSSRTLRLKERNKAVIKETSVHGEGKTKS